MPQITDEFLTERQVCGHADYQIPVSQNTLRKSRYTGKLLGHPAPEFVKVGRSVRYRRTEVEAWRSRHLRSYSCTAEYRNEVGVGS